MQYCDVTWIITFSWLWLLSFDYSLPPHSCTSQLWWTSHRLIQGRNLQTGVERLVKARWHAGIKPVTSCFCKPSIRHIPDPRVSKWLHLHTPVFFDLSVSAQATNKYSIGLLFYCLAPITPLVQGCVCFHEGLLTPVFVTCESVCVGI